MAAPSHSPLAGGDEAEPLVAGDNAPGKALRHASQAILVIRRRRERLAMGSCANRELQS